MRFTHLVILVYMKRKIVFVSMHNMIDGKSGCIGLEMPKAYIPLQRKIPGVGGWLWAMPPMPEFCFGDTNMLVYFGVT